MQKTGKLSRWMLVALAAAGLALLALEVRAQDGSATPQTAAREVAEVALGQVSRDIFETPKPTPDDAKVAEAVAKGLKHIVSLQQDDGSWRNDIGFKLGTGRGAYRIIPGGSDRPHIGVTALCCMALMANGHTVDRGEYQTNVRAGLAFVLRNIDSFGRISAHGSRMYSHAFATLFLCEVYGMTGDLTIRPALHRAVSFIVKNQVSGVTEDGITFSTPNEGGWRYEPGQQDADTSITVCQVQALRAARNVGFVVPQHAIDQAREYIVGNYRPEAGYFTYQPEAGFGRTSMALTAAGVVSLQSAGEYETYHSPSGVLVDLQQALRFIQANRPDSGRQLNSRMLDFAFWYGHYYAAQAFRQYGHARPDMWRNWNRQNRESFIAMQQPNGAWQDEVGGNDARYNAYATAMACLVLSIPNDYLPIFQN